MKEREGDQPLPIPNEHMDIQSQVIADIEARRQVGIERYGTALQPFNGRDGLRDLYEELLDACMYVKQCMVEITTLKQLLYKGIEFTKDIHMGDEFADWWGKAYDLTRDVHNAQPL